MGTLQELLDSIQPDDPRAKIVADPRFQAFLEQASHLPDFGGSGVFTQNLKALFPGLIPEGYRVVPKSGELAKNMSTAQKIATAVSVLAIPFTLGASTVGTGNLLSNVKAAGDAAGQATKYGNLIGEGANFLSGASKQQTENRVYGDQAQTEYNDQLLARSREEDNRALLDLQRKRFSADDYQRNSNNAVRGGLLMGLQDMNVQAPAGIPMGTVTGGLRPSAILNKDAIGNTMQSTAMKNLLNPQAFDPMNPIPQPSKPTPPSGMEKGTGIASGVLPLIGTALDMFRKSGRPKTPAPQGTENRYSSLSPRPSSR